MKNLSFQRFKKMTYKVNLIYYLEKTTHNICKKLQIFNIIEIILTCFTFYYFYNTFYKFKVPQFDSLKHRIHLCNLLHKNNEPNLIYLIYNRYPNLISRDNQIVFQIITKILYKIEDLLVTLF